MILSEFTKTASYNASHCSFRLFQSRGVSPTLEHRLMQSIYLEWKHFCHAPTSASIFSVSGEVQQEDILTSENIKVYFLGLLMYGAPVTDEPN